MTIRIKPHHLLDVFKLYGRGIDSFVPDPAFGHDFYLIGNRLIGGEVEFVVLTTGADDICAPCRFNRGGVCGDVLDFGETTLKDDYNVSIDQGLLEAFALEPDRPYELTWLLKKLEKDITPEIIGGVWNTRNRGENETRFYDTSAGLKRCLAAAP